MNNTIVINVSKQIPNQCYYMNLQATKQLMDLFDSISKHPLLTSDDYIKMYAENFYTFHTWEELVKSEAEQSDGLTESECEAEIGVTIWQLPCGWYVQYV